MLKLCRVTKVKVFFLVLVNVFNFDLFEFSTAILEKGLFSAIATHHMTRILRRLSVLPSPRRQPQFRIRMNVKKRYYFVFVFRKISSDVWRLCLGKRSFARKHVSTRFVNTISFSYGRKTTCLCCETLVSFAAVFSLVTQRSSPQSPSETHALK